MSLSRKIKGKIDAIQNSAWVKRLIGISRLLILPGFEKVPLYDVMKFFIESLIKGQLFQRTAALTYHIFIALIPILMALFSFISFLGESVRRSLYTFLESIVPDYVWPALADVIQGVVMRQNGTLFSFSFLLGLWLSYFCVNAIVNILNTTYFDIQKRNFFRQTLINIGLLFSAILIIISIVVIFSLRVPMLQYITAHITLPAAFTTTFVLILKWLLIFMLIYTMVSAFYYFAPINKKYFRYFSAGSTFCSVFMVLLLWVMDIYFSNFSNYNLLYGSIGALFAILLCIYWNCFIFLLGFDLNVSIYMAKQNSTADTPFVLHSTISESNKTQL